MEVLVCDHTYEMIRNEFSCSDHGEHDVRGFGLQQIWKLDRAFAAANDALMF